VDLFAREQAHQRGLAGVGVANERRAEMPRAGDAAAIARLADPLELAADLRHPVADALLGELHVRMPAGSAAAATLAVAERVVVAHAGKLVFEPRELDLELGLARAGARFEDAQDHLHAVEHFDTEGPLQIAALTGPELVVDHHHEVFAERWVRLGGFGDDARPSGALRDLAQLALPDVGRPDGLAPPLHEGSLHRDAQALEELAELVERALDLLVGNATGPHGEEDGATMRFGSGTMASHEKTSVSVEVAKRQSGCAEMALGPSCARDLSVERAFRSTLR